jgi:hypothetical protein
MAQLSKHYRHRHSYTRNAIYNDLCSLIYIQFGDNPVDTSQVTALKRQHLNRSLRRRGVVFPCRDSILLVSTDLQEIANTRLD